MKSKKYYLQGFFFTAQQIVHYFKTSTHFIEPESEILVHFFGTI